MATPIDRQHSFFLVKEILTGTTQSVSNLRPLSAHKRNAIRMALCWQADTHCGRTVRAYCLILGISNTCISNLKKHLKPYDRTRIDFNFGLISFFLLNLKNEIHPIRGGYHLYEDG